MPSFKAKVGPEHHQGVHGEQNRSQWDTLMLTLWMSRLLGVAPVRFQKDRSGCPVIVSRAENAYSKLLIILLHACLLVGTVIDLIDGSCGVRVQGNWTRFTYLTELTILISTTSVGAFGASERLHNTFTYLEAIDKMKIYLEGPRVHKNSKICSIATILYVACVIILHAADFYTFYVDSFFEDKDYVVMYFYVCFYIEMTVVSLLELEFMWVAMFVHSGLKAINHAMEDLIYYTDLQRATTPVTVEDLLVVDTSHIPFPVKHVNTLVDTMTSRSVDMAPRQPNASKYVQESIRRIAVSYGTICDVIAGINDYYGLLLLLFVAKFVLSFVVTPFYFYKFWYSSKPRRINLIVQICFVIYHFSAMLVVVEPGYWTEKEDEKTRALTRQLMQRASSPLDPMLEEVDILLKQINLNSVAYSPLKFCKLTRALIPVILGGATTYLVIILQFQRMV